jgi:hypothetical protein
MYVCDVRMISDKCVYTCDDECRLAIDTMTRYRVQLKLQSEPSLVQLVQAARTCGCSSCGKCHK